MAGHPSEPSVPLTPKRELEGKLLVRWARTLEEHGLSFEAWISKINGREYAPYIGY